MYSKQDCRNYLIEVRPYINLTQIAKKTNISRVLLTNVIKDEAFMSFISKEKLNMIVKFIQEL